MSNYNSFSNYNAFNNVRSGAPIQYTVLEKIGVVAAYKTGWTREVNVISWNGNSAKLDIRDWDPDHIRMKKGLTFTEEEAFALARILENRFPYEAQQEAHIRVNPQMQHPGQFEEQDDYLQDHDDCMLPFEEADEDMGRACADAASGTDEFEDAASGIEYAADDADEDTYEDEEAAVGF